MYIKYGIRIKYLRMGTNIRDNENRGDLVAL
jgi:hypothetical protein